MASESEQDMRQYLEGVDYPVRAANLVAAAKDGSNIPAEVVHRLGQLPSDAEFSGPDEVVEQLENIESSGKQIPTTEDT